MLCIELIYSILGFFDKVKVRKIVFHSYIGYIPLQLTKCQSAFLKGKEGKETIYN